MAIFPQSYSYRDLKGKTAWIRIWIGAGNQANAIVQAQNIGTALNAISNAAFQNARGGWTSSPTVPSYGGSGQYADCDDRLDMIWATNAGGQFHLTIPAPIVGAFLPDAETMSFTGTSVGNLITVIQANNLRTRDDNHILTCLGGSYKRRNLHRRFGLFLKNPQLTTPSV